MKNVWKTTIVVFILGGANLLAGPPENIRKAPIKPWPPKIEFNKRLSQNKPEVILIGNSMLGEGIDSRQLTLLLGQNVEKLEQGGTASAWWYLVFKNIVLQTKIKPKVVVFFFRDHYLTEPKYRTTGYYRRRIEGMADSTDHRLDRLVFEPQGIDRYLEKISIYQKRGMFKNRIENTIKDVIATKLTKTTPGEPQKAIDRIFDEQHLDSVQLTREQIKAEKTKSSMEETRFDNQVGDSFLPDILQMAAKNGIQIIFVRVKRRRDLLPNKEPVSVKEYMVELKTYLAREKIPLLDFTHDERLQNRHYAVGDHLDRKLGRPLFTKLLAEHLKAIVQVTK